MATASFAHLILGPRSVSRRSWRRSRHLPAWAEAPHMACCTLRWKILRLLSMLHPASSSIHVLQWNLRSKFLVQPQVWDFHTAFRHPGSVLSEAPHIQQTAHSPDPGGVSSFYYLLPIYHIVSYLSYYKIMNLTLFKNHCTNPEIFISENGLSS